MQPSQDNTHIHVKECCFLVGEVDIKSVENSIDSCADEIRTPMRFFPVLMMMTDAVRLFSFLCCCRFPSCSPLYTCVFCVCLNDDDRLRVRLPLVLFPSFLSLRTVFYAPVIPVLPTFSLSYLFLRPSPYLFFTHS